MKGHFHIDENGKLHRCLHQCKTAITSYGFWLGVTVSFPLEHYLWEKVWPFTLLTKWMGLS